MDLETGIGIVASALTSSALIPQLIKLIKEKKAEDVSIVMLAVLLIGLALWIYYGILKNDPIISISNAFAALINVSTFILTVRFKKQGSRQANT
jgi:MtN3 and saliva related transmembrane protein